MVGYDEVRVITDNTISIRTAEYGDMGSITIAGITFQNIPGFYTMNKQDMNEFLAEKSKPPVGEGKSLLESAGIDREDVEKVMQGNINYKGKDGLIEIQAAWLIVYNEYDRKQDKEVTKMALVTEKGWYAKVEPRTVLESPTKEPMEARGFPGKAYYIPAYTIKGGAWLEEGKIMPERIPLQ